MHKLKELRALCGDVDGTVPVAVRKLALLSLLEVFRDIIPIYRVRVHTQTEKRQSVNARWVLPLAEAKGSLASSIYYLRVN